MNGPTCASCGKPLPEGAVACPFCFPETGTASSPSDRSAPKLRRPWPVVASQVLIAGFTVFAAVAALRSFPAIIQRLSRPHSVVGSSPLLWPIARYAIMIAISVVLPAVALLGLMRRRAYGRWLGAVALLEFLCFSALNEFSLNLYRVILHGPSAYHPTAPFLPIESARELAQHAILNVVWDLFIGLLAFLLVFQRTVARYFSGRA